MTEQCNTQACPGYNMPPLYTLFQNGYNFIILLNSCKLALDASIPLRNSFEF